MEFKNRMNQHLLNFLKIWKEEVMSGNPRSEFTEDGICSCFDDYLEELDEEFPIDGYGFLFEYHFEKVSYPFSTVMEFNAERIYGKMHLNKKRVAWVNKTIIELEKNNVR